MKGTDFLEGLVFFFNDLIGAVVPGAIVVAGVVFLGVPGECLVAGDSQDWSSGDWLFIVVAAYVVGHGLLGLNRIVPRRIRANLQGLSLFLLSGTWNTEPMSVLISKGKAYQLFKNQMIRLLNEPEIVDVEFDDIRTMAMSVSKEAAELARRFRFISLFCSGIAMAVLILSAYLIIRKWHEFSLGGSALVMFIASILFVLFYARSVEFEKRAINVPFAVALGEISVQGERDAGSD